MADNSIREQILKKLVSKMEDIPAISTVKRVQPSDIKELQNYASTELPLVSVVGSLPDPQPHVSTRRRGDIDDLFNSELSVQITVWFMNRVDPDSQLSSLADDIWSKLYEDQLLDGLTISLSVHPRVEVAVWDPYVGFNVVVKTNYIHGTGGI